MNSITLNSTSARALGFVAVEFSPADFTRLLVEKIDALRTELADLAFALDQRGNPTAADIATLLSNRLAELEIEFGLAGKKFGAEPLSSSTTSGMKRLAR